MKRIGVSFLEDYQKMKSYMEKRDYCSNIFILKFIFNFLIELQRKKFVKKYGSEPKKLL